MCLRYCVRVMTWGDCTRRDSHRSVYCEYDIQYVLNIFKKININHKKANITNYIYETIIITIIV